MNPGTAVTLIALLVGGPDMYQQFGFFPATPTWSTPDPGKVTAGRYLQGPAQRRDRKAPVLLLDEPVSHRGALVKIPTAFFRISFSSFRRAFSR